ncbi:hypothetical protein HPP92_008783 [Vanilla planifolia]|uniref:Uncharacterized protein n=1 Tax=Vanilla planifolia TaxID=51239 RepID=A0A835V298_VANPL|nr:hypothetical protein HPP92_008783 [Vanilla planifolia]
MDSVLRSSHGEGIEETEGMTWMRSTRWAWGKSLQAAQRMARRLPPPAHTATATVASSSSSVEDIIEFNIGGTRHQIRRKFHESTAQDFAH